MKSATFVLLFSAVLFALPVSAQREAGAVVNLTVVAEADKAPVARAAVEVGRVRGQVVGGKGSVTDVPPGTVTLRVTAEGFAPYSREVTLVAGGTLDLTVELEAAGEEEEDEELAVVIVNTTRTGREIEDEPTRVEAIAGEEIDEKTNMRASNVSMILNESTGIKVQQTSATAYTQSIRIQGLDGRYTQLLKDGFPAYGGFSGSLSILDILPLDLKQVEIIKGSASTFYGGGAIAGVINFISKEPSDKPSTSLLLNQTSAVGSDASVFTTRRLGGFAYTFLGSVNLQRAYDADGDLFTDLPRTRSFTVSPRLFFDASDRTRVVFGNSTTVQRRTGGDILVVRGRPGPSNLYFERNDSERNVSTLQVDRELEGGGRLSFKQSVSVFSREISVPGYVFGGRQANSFSEATFARAFGKHAVVAGLNFVHDRFAEDAAPSGVRRDERQSTLGVFVQDTVELGERVAVEGGLRLDRVAGRKTFVLPRASVLFRLREGLTSRVGFGFGYKVPSLFTEESETRLFRNVLGTNRGLEAETSRGGTFDVNYRRELGEDASVSINQMFFVTDIDNALVLSPSAGGDFAFINAPGKVSTKGFETNLRARYGLVNAFAGFTYTDATADHLPGTRMLTLTPKGRFNSAVLLERERDFKAGLEAYFTGRQTLADRSLSPSYWVLGLFAEKTLGRYAVFFNAENVTDTRQTRFGPVVFPPASNPTFAEIYTHTEGRVFNGGVKIRF